MLDDYMTVALPDIRRLVTSLLQVVSTTTPN